MRRWIAIAVVAPWAAWAIARTVGLDRVHPLIAFAAFTPYAALTAPVAILVALALRRWLAAIVAVAATGLLALAVLPRAFGSSAPAGDGARTVTVMTSNLYAGRGDAERVMALVRRYDVDVLNLEELTPDALERLDAAGASEALPTRAVEPRDGGRGNGILARHRLRRIDVWSQPREPGVDVSLPGGGVPLRVRVVHPFPPLRPASAREWRDHLDALPPAADAGGPAVLAGDFNATLDHRAFRSLLDRGWTDAADAVGEGLRPTWPVGRRILGLTIDHVLVGGGIRVRAVHVHEIPGSDHRAVVAELVLPREPAT